MVTARSASMPPKNTKTPSTTPSGKGGAGGGQGSGGGSGLKQDLRGMSFAEGEARLAPTKNGAAPKDGGPAKNGAPPVKSVSTASLAKVTDDLGEIEDMPSFSAVLGQFLERLVPGEGTGVEAELKIGVKGPAFHGKFNVKTGVKHTSSGYELSGGIGLEVGARIEDPMFGAYIEAFAKGSLGVTAKGDSGQECFRLVGLGIHEYLANEAEITNATTDEKLRQAVQKMSIAGTLGPALARALFGQRYAEGVLAEMDGLDKGDGADVLECEGEVSAGVGIGLGGGEDDAKGRMGVGYRSKSTLGKGADGKLAKGSESGWFFQASAEGTIGGQKVKGEVSFFKKPDSESEVELKVELPVSGTSVAASAGVIWDTWSGIVRMCVAHGKGKLPAAELKRVEDALTQTARGAATAQLMKSGFFHPALEFKGKYAGQKLTLGIDLVQSKGYSKDATIGGQGAKVEAEVKTSSTLFEQSFPLPLADIVDKAKQLAAR